MERYNIQPSFNSDLTSTLFRMESLRSRLLTGNTPPWLFYDLKATLHVLESLNSARIEGNHTTLAEVIAEATNRNNGEDSDKRTSKINPQPRDDIAEIINIQNAINYIHGSADENDRDKISKAFRYYNNLSMAQRAYFNAELLNQMRKFKNEADADHEHRERRRAEERRREQMRRSSYHNSSSSFGGGSHFSGFGGHSSGGGASRGF